MQTIDLNKKKTNLKLVTEETSIFSHFINEMKKKKAFLLVISSWPDCNNCYRHAT